MQYACALMPVYSNICIYIRIAMYIYIYIYVCVCIYIYMRPRLRSVAHAAFIQIHRRYFTRNLERRSRSFAARLTSNSSTASREIKSTVDAYTCTRLCVCMRAGGYDKSGAIPLAEHSNQSGSGRVYTRHHRSEYKTPYGIYLTI